MKKLLITISICLLAAGTFAQERAGHIISIYAAGILNKTRLSYEKTITYDRSIGLTFTNYDKLSNYKGGKAELFVTTQVPYRNIQSIDNKCFIN